MQPLQQHVIDWLPYTMKSKYIPHPLLLHPPTRHPHLTSRSSRNVATHKYTQTHITNAHSLPRNCYYNEVC